jgi:hypothetical protein
MNRRVILVGALAAGMLVLGGQGSATANVLWCMSDPPIPLVTPGGHNITVNNMVYISVADRHLAKLITDDASVARDGHGGTLITIHVYIPSAVHGAAVVSSNYRYQVHDWSSAPGGGRVLTLILDVPTS